jgi:site-specific DNA recombinase
VGSGPRLRAIRHREKIYPGAHPEIIDHATWVAVQAVLERTRAGRKTSTKIGQTPLLRGRLHDDLGGAMQAIHTKRGEKRYRYYATASRGPQPSVGRIAMGVLDEFVLGHAGELLSSGWSASGSIEERVRSALIRVTLGEDRVELILRREAVLAKAHAAGQLAWTEDSVTLGVPIRLKHRHGAISIVSSEGRAGSPRMDRALVRAVALTRQWADRLAAGEVGSLKELALSEGYCEHYAAKMLPLAWLAPDLVEAILDGRQQRSLSLGALMRRPLPMDWSEQRSLFAAIG